MSATREQLDQLLDSLTEDALDEVNNFVQVLLREPDELTEDEEQEVEEAEKEMQRGDWVRWDDIKRTDV